MKKLALVMASLLLMVTIVGCGEDPYKDYPKIDEQIIESQGSYKELVKDSLYYIPASGSDFAIKYEIFLNKNPQFEIIDAEANPNEHYHNKVYGYYIFVKLKEE